MHMSGGDWLGPIGPTSPGCMHDSAVAFTNAVHPWVKFREALEIESNIRQGLRAELIAVLQKDARHFESLATGVIRKVSFAAVRYTDTPSGARLQSSALHLS